MSVPGPVERSLARFVPPEETVLLRMRPGAAFFIAHKWWLVLPAILLLAIYFAGRALAGPGALDKLPLIAAGAVAAFIVIQVLSWLSRQYVLTDRRAICIAGLLRQGVGDVPLRNIQHLTVSRSVLERLFGQGTIGIASAGADGPAIYWLTVPRPEAVLATIREAMARARGEPLRLEMTMSDSRPLVVGLAGGIGAGKSEVARAMEGLGAVISDSDRAAKEALNRPRVRDELVRWWGDQVLGPDGRVDRKAVAGIVFDDPTQRERLEGLIHPLVREDRAELVGRAQRAGATAVVVDAPLLFEAGVDRECDAVIFVDAPLEQRLQRVKESRGWDRAELDRREAAQLPLDEKRRRCRYVLANDAGPVVLRERVGELFGRIRRDLGVS